MAAARLCAGMTGVMVKRSWNSGCIQREEPLAAGRISGQIELSCHLIGQHFTVMLAIQPQYRRGLLTQPFLMLRKIPPGEFRVVVA